jgi:hypothetical protein
VGKPRAKSKAFPFPQELAEQPPLLKTLLRQSEAEELGST